MKRKLPACMTLTLLVALTIQALVAAQQAPRYRLVDLGTFGGPASYFSAGYDGLNNHGTAVGLSNTTIADPICFVRNCFATHAFQWQNGLITDLGALPGGDVSQAVWISANGLTVGMSENGEFDPLVPGFPEVRGVLWRGGGIIDLGTLPEGGYESLANAVNNRGQAVGFAFNTVPDPCSLIGFPTQTRAFIWQDGAMQDLGTLGGSDANAELINDRGQIAGLSYTDSINPATGCPTWHPFLWQNGTMVDTGTLGGAFADVRFLNQRGEVVGWSTLAGDQTFHPFLWSKGQLIDLGTLGGDNGETNWINDRGDIVGRADLPGPTPQLHDAVLWKDGKVVDLGVLPGDSCSNAYFVNSHGQVVGTSENQQFCMVSPDPVGQHAFLWEQGTMVDLNTLIPPGASLDLTYAVAINGRGEIAGFGVPPNCAPEDYELCGHAYMLIPCGAGEECVNTTAVNSIPLAIPSFVNASPARPQTGPANLRDRFRNQMRQRFHLQGQGRYLSD